MPVPIGWREGGGAAGCRASHCRCIEMALHAGCKRFLVLEDDFCMRSTFVEEAERVFSDVPDDWQLLMLGGQHIHDPRNYKKGVKKCTNTQRTHAMAWKNARMVRYVYAQWMGITSTVHIDWQLGSMTNRYPVYAPDPFLFGQTRSMSDICGRVNPAKFWAPPSGQEWVVVLDAPKEVVSGLREFGLHTGYDRDSETDIDKGLLEVCKGNDVEHKLRKWIVDLQWECVSEEAWYWPYGIQRLKRKWCGSVGLDQ